MSNLTRAEWLRLDALLRALDDFCDELAEAHHTEELAELPPAVETMLMMSGHAVKELQDLVPLPMEGTSS